MLAEERRTLILERLHDYGQVRTAELVDELNVSSMTVRNDLAHLEQQGRVQRTHGGAVLADGHSVITRLDVRLARNRELKHRIAKVAATYVRDREAIILDAGSTTHALAQFLPPVSDLVVLTPGLNIAQSLLDREGVEARMLGGRLVPEWFSTVGTPAEQGLGDVLVRKLFLGTHGVDDDLDLVDVSTELARCKRQLVSAARQVILLLDSTKWHQREAAKVMSISAVDIVITDDKTPRDILERLAEKDVEVVIA